MICYTRGRAYLCHKHDKKLNLQPLKRIYVTVTPKELKKKRTGVGVCFYLDRSGQRGIGDGSVGRMLMGSYAYQLKSSAV